MIFIRTIEHVDGTTDCVTPIEVAPKPKSKSKEICICVDIRLPKIVIKRTCHIIRNIDDMIFDLNGACVFSKRDFRQGYLSPVVDITSLRIQRTLHCTDTYVSVLD